MPTAFISHSSEDVEMIERDILPVLRGKGVDVWYSPTSIRSAEEWERSIKLGMESSDWFLVVVSPNSVKSKWVRAETSWAFSNREGKIVPVLIGQCNPFDLHMLLPEIQFADCRRDVKKGAEELTALVGSSNAPPPDKVVDVFPLAGLAYSMIARGDSAGAIREINDGLEIAPNNLGLLTLRGIAHLQLPDAERAIADFSRALESHPNQLVRSQLLYHRARAYAMKRDDRRAISDCTESIKADANHGDAYYLRGQVRRRGLDTDDAIFDLSEAIRLSPTNAEIFVQRAEAYRQKGDTGAARADYQKAAQLDPASVSKVPAHLLQDSAQGSDSGRMEDAMRSLRAVAFFAQFDKMQPEAKVRALNEVTRIGFPKIFSDLDYLIANLPKESTEYNAAVFAEQVARQSGLKK